MTWFPTDLRIPLGFTTWRPWGETTTWLRSCSCSYSKVQRCECYCCSNDHKDPCGSKIPCDRQLVFNTVREWYGKAEGESGHSWAEEFNELVKGHLSDVVQSSLSHTFAEVGLASRLTVPWIVLLAPLMLAPLANPLDEMQDTQQLAWYITVVLDWFKMVCVFLLNTGRGLQVSGVKKLESGHKQHTLKLCGSEAPGGNSSCLFFFPKEWNLVFFKYFNYRKVAGEVVSCWLRHGWPQELGCTWRDLEINWDEVAQTSWFQKSNVSQCSKIRCFPSVSPNYFSFPPGLIWRMMPLMQVLSQRLPRWVAALLCILTVQLLTGLAWLPYEVHLLRQGSRALVIFRSHFNPDISSNLTHKRWASHDHGFQKKSWRVRNTRHGGYPRKIYWTFSVLGVQTSYSKFKIVTVGPELRRC